MNKSISWCSVLNENWCIIAATGVLCLASMKYPYGFAQKFESYAVRIFNVFRLLNGRVLWRCENVSGWL